MYDTAYKLSRFVDKGMEIGWSLLIRITKCWCDTIHGLEEDAIPPVFLV